MRSAPPWTRFVAIGDSFTEGMVDEYPDRPGVYRGWADLLAGELSRRRIDAGLPPLEYMNLAIRGRLMSRIVAEQVPIAMERLSEPSAASQPRLVSLIAGGNDVIRPGTDIDPIMAMYEESVRRLRSTGADVLLAMGPDLANMLRVKALRGKIGIYNATVASIARRYGCLMMDVWGMREIYDPRLWGEDRLHPSTEGHRILAAAALGALGEDERIEGQLPRQLPPLPPAARWERARLEAHWVRHDLGPWVGRRLRRESSGDDILAKLPEPLALGGDPLGDDVRGGPDRMTPNDKEVTPMTDPKYLPTVDVPDEGANLAR